MYSDYKLVRQCLLRIEKLLDWGPSDSWHNDMFIELSERIQQQTKVLLSPVTLKRVWGRIGYKSAPSITTLNTLAQFAGFQNWRDFKSKVSVKNSSGVPRKIGANLGIIMLSASIMTVIFISFYSLREPEAAVTDLSQIVFKSKPIAQGLPNSVVFNLVLDAIKSDNIHIQQYWDPTKTIDLSPGQKQATGQYYYPGYFRAKLVVDGKAIKQHDLFIKSEGWLGTLDYRPIPKYLKTEAVFNDKLSFPPEIIAEIISRKEPLNTTFHMVKDFDSISGDNFELKSTLRNAYRDKWAVCQKASIIILGTKGAVVISFAIPGCASELGIMMNDVYLNGKEHDLSMFGLDLTQPNAIKIQVKNKKVKVFHEDLQLFSGAYTETLGRIAGLRYRFLGVGEVLESKLSSLTGETVIDFLSENMIAK